MDEEKLTGYDWIDTWMNASTEERERMEEETRQRLIRELAGVDDETAERLGF